MIAGMVFYCSTPAQVGKNYTVGDIARWVDLPGADVKDSSVLIGDDKTYHRFFGTYSEKELPVFDFAKEYLTGS